MKKPNWNNLKSYKCIKCGHYLKQQPPKSYIPNAEDTHECTNEKCDFKIRESSFRETLERMAVKLK